MRTRSTRPASSTPPGKSFFWEGSYLDNLNEAKTLNTELNVFAGFEPKIPAAYHDSEFLFLANIDPVLQRRVREAMPHAKLVGGDTMNYWIKDHKPALLEVLKGLDVLLINDTETRMLAGDSSIVLAARQDLRDGPEDPRRQARRVRRDCILRPEKPDGSERIARRAFHVPALPLEEVVDPTGAGDSFAGGFFGYLASQKELTPASFRLRHVLRQRHGLLCRGALRHRTPAAAHARRNRPPLQALPRADAP